MAKRFDTLSSIQFSIFLRASSHIPAHAVVLAQASQNGTVDEVNLLSIKYSNLKPTTTMAITTIHCSKPVSTTCCRSKFNNSSKCARTYGIIYSLRRHYPDQVFGNDLSLLFSWSSQTRYPLLFRILRR